MLPLLLLLSALLPFLAPSSTLVSAYTALTDTTLQSLPRPGADFDIQKGKLLAPILQTRVPGTEGSDKVLEHFVHFFIKNLPAWNIAFHNSTSTTPSSQGKQVPFRNLIISRDPPWAREGDVQRLTLVAHYDSKREPDGFIGATDSAAPCAMIMHAARSLDKALTKKWAAMTNDDEFEGAEEEKGIQVLLLDGEEAFVSWTDDDSLYGARALAEDWDTTFHPALSTFRTPLSSISLFVLLDLLGTATPTVPSYFRTTHWAYEHMASLETRLRSLNLFKSQTGKDGKPFLPDANKGNSFQSFMVQDDHIPFMARGVDVLHLIPSPFPWVWHRIEDDGEHLDIDTSEDWAVLVTAFAAEWMDLEGFFEADGKETRSVNGKGEAEQDSDERDRRKQVTSKSELL